MKGVHTLLVAVFIAVICLPAVQMKFQFYQEIENLENRKLAEPPELRLHAIPGLPQQVDRFIGDHFGFRRDLIRWNNILRYRLLNEVPIESVIAGKDGWLFYRSEAVGDGHSINDYVGDVPLSTEEIGRLQAILEGNERLFKSKGIVYIVVIAPNKNTIYHEYLPDNIRRHKARTRLDQVMDHMSKSSPMKIIDLREALFREKAGWPLYLKTDSHWSAYGAFVGYREIAARLSQHFPGIGQVTIDGGRITVEQSEHGGDLARIMSMRDLLPEGCQTTFELARRPETGQLSSLIFRHDSFGDNLYPFLSRHFKKITGAPPFAPFKPDVIEKERPEVVLHVFAERYITQALHDDFYYVEAPLYRRPDR